MQQGKQGSVPRNLDKLRREFLPGVQKSRVECEASIRRYLDQCDEEFEWTPEDDMRATTELVQEIAAATTFTASEVAHAMSRACSVFEKTAVEVLKSFSALSAVGKAVNDALKDSAIAAVEFEQINQEVEDVIEGNRKAIE